MKIEIKNLKVARSLSEETHAYTATIYVDGKPAFHASNHGTGGCDSYHPIAPFTYDDVKQIDEYLKANYAPHGPHEADPAKRSAWDNGLPMDLELFVGGEIERAEADRDWKRVLNRVTILRDGNIYTYPAKFKPTPENLAKVRNQMLAKGDHGDLVNGATDEVQRKAKVAFGLKADDSPEGRHEAVLERMRENRMTSADARYLLALEAKAAKPCAETIARLTKVAEAGEAAYAAYCAERDAARQPATA